MRRSTLAAPRTPALVPSESNGWCIRLKRKQGEGDRVLAPAKHSNSSTMKTVLSLALEWLSS